VRSCRTDADRERALVDLVARYLRGHGVADVAVLEAPTVYGYWFRHRSVEEVARYFGFVFPNSRSVDISSDVRPVHFEQGFVQRARRAPIGFATRLVRTASQRAFGLRASAR
jgi:hypothetical protein